MVSYKISNWLLAIKNIRFRPQAHRSKWEAFLASHFSLKRIYTKNVVNILFTNYLVELFYSTNLLKWKIKRVHKKRLEPCTVCIKCTAHITKKFLLTGSSSSSTILIQWQNYGETKIHCTRRISYSSHKWRQRKVPEIVC